MHNSQWYPLNLSLTKIIKIFLFIDIFFSDSDKELKGTFVNQTCDYLKGSLQNCVLFNNAGFYIKKGKIA